MIMLIHSVSSGGDRVIFTHMKGPFTNRIGPN